MTESLTLTADVSLSAAAAADKPATVRILAYSGGEIKPSGWAGPVVVDVAGLTLGRIPLLVDHDASLSGVVGSGMAAAESGSVTVTGTLSRSSDAGTKLISLSRDGVTWQASVGLDVQSHEFIQPGKSVNTNNKTFTAGPRGLTVIRSAKLREVSILSLGADSTTVVQIAARKGKNMTDENTTTITEADEPIELQLARVTNTFIESHPSFRDRFSAIEAKAVAESWDASQLEVALLRASRPLVGSRTELDQLIASATPGSSNVPGQMYAAPTQRNVLEASLLIRAGQEDAAVTAYGAQATEAARRSGPTNLVDVCAAALRAEHRDIPHGHEATIRAAFSTETLPTVLENTVGRSMIQPFNDTTSNWRSFATIKSAANFKSQKSARPSSFETLEQLGATGEIKHTTLGEDGVYDWSVSTFARMIGITRETIINDDLGWLDEYAPLLGQAAGRSLNDLIWSTIMANAGSFFSSGNNNLLEAGSDLDIVSLTAAVAAMRKQVDARGFNIDNAPVALAVPPDIEATARTLLNSSEIVAVTDVTTPNGNPMMGIVPNLVSEARLSNTDRFSGASAASWYLFAGPMSNAVIVGFLRGKQTPTVETSNADFNKLGIQLRCFLDYGVALGDSRGGLKATGAGAG